jgi:hypothetical protein
MTATLTTLKQGRFSPGQTVITPGALDAIAQAEQHPGDFLQRHLSGDWGELCDEDITANEQALIEGLRLMSSYRTSKGQRIWVITEADRSATTILLPEEY